MNSPEVYSTEEVLRTATAFREAGFNVVPVREDGSKQPDLSAWMDWQSELIPRSMHDRWFGGTYRQTGVGLITGFNGLMVVDFDDADTFELAGDTADAIGFDTFRRLVEGCSERTPSGGAHIFYQCSETPTNQKIAVRSLTGVTKAKALIETRGQGGFIVISPSHGHVHQSGQPYGPRTGDVSTIATLTPEEQQGLFDFLESFNEVETDRNGTRLSIPPRPTSDERPGDAYNRQATEQTFRGLTEAEGWKWICKRGQVWYLRRPGKERGFSATWNWNDLSLLRVFTTSTNLDARMHDAFGLYTSLRFSGDFQESGKALFAEGYGKQSSPTLSLNRTPDDSSPAIHQHVKPSVFPDHILPTSMRDYCKAQAIAIGVPVEMIAMPLLAFTGALVGDRVHLLLKRGYRQYPTLFLAIIAAVGAAKSPALAAAQWPINVLQKESHSKYKTELETYESDLERWSFKPKGERGEKPGRPRLRHYYTTDATIEALVSILEQSPGVSIVRDELMSFLNSMNQYRNGKGADHQQYLSLHATAPIKADRRTGEPVYKDHPVACVVGGIQPDILPELHSKDGRRDGMFERFIPIRPEFEPQRWSDDDVDPKLLDAVVDLLRDLDRINFLDSVDNPDGLVTQLHPSAKVLWVEWFNENAALKDEATGLLQGFYSKLSNHVARFALILNLSWNPDNPNVLVSEERMRDAIELGEWVREHIHSTMPLLGVSIEPKVKGVRSRIIRILNEVSEDDRWLNRGDLLKKLGNVPTEALQAALDYMFEFNEVEMRAKPGSKTKPAEQWRINSLDGVELSNNLHQFPDTQLVELSNNSNNLRSKPDSRGHLSLLSTSATTELEPTGTEGGWIDADTL